MEIARKIVQYLPFWRKMSFAKKLVLHTWLTTGVALLITCSAVIITNYFDTRNAIVRSLTTQADIIGTNSTAAISFSDRQAAEETLAGLVGEKNIAAAYIFTPDGKLFAQYATEALDRFDTEAWQQKLHVAGYQFQADYLLMNRPINMDGKMIGSVSLVYQLEEMHQRLAHKIFIVLRFMALALIAAIWMGTRFQRVLSKPIEMLVQTADNISDQKDYSLRVPITSQDELGLLSTTFNNMLTQIQARDSALQKSQDQLERRVLERTQELKKTNDQLSQQIIERLAIEAEREIINQKLVKTSRQAGMAEVATGVLHNVGNVLNSVNVSASVALRTLSQSRLEDLVKLSVLIDQYQDDLGTFVTQDSRGKMLPKFLDIISSRLTTEQNQMASELNELTKNIDHIKQVVNMQQSYAKVSGVIESVALEELVGDALKMYETGLSRHQIAIQTQYEDIPPILTDKHQILQILINLIGNAKHALSASEQPDKCLQISIGKNDSEIIRIEVADNGQGISEENLLRIFSHGFTTKKEGHGFGLHSGALAAKQLGGSLNVQSDGLGKGAKFILELPAIQSQSTSSRDRQVIPQHEA